MFKEIKRVSVKQEKLINEESVMETMTDNLPGMRTKQGDWF